MAEAQNVVEPEAPETPETPEPSPAKPDDSSFPVDDLLDDAEDDGQEPEPAPEPEPKPEPEPTPEPEPEPEPTPEPEPEPETPPAEPQPPEQPEPQKTPEQLRAEEAARRVEFEKSLNELYRPQVAAVADKLLENPEEVLTNLAAKLHMAVVEAAVHGIMAQVPQVIQRTMVQRQTVADTERKFYERWPQLAQHKAKAEKMLQTMGQVYRQTNPNASVQDWIENVGAMVMVALKVPHEQPQAPAAPSQQPAQPVESGHSPAMPGGGSPGAQRKPQPGVWESLADEFDEDDRAI